MTSDGHHDAAFLLNQQIIKSTFYLLKQISTNVLQANDEEGDRLGMVIWVAILNNAAIGSNWNHGGLVVNISTAVHPNDLNNKTCKMKLVCFEYCKVSRKNKLIVTLGSSAAVHRRCSSDTKLSLL